MGVVHSVKSVGHAGSPSLLRQVNSAAVLSAVYQGGSLPRLETGWPGVLEPPSGWIMLTPQTPGWEGFPLAERLAATRGRPVLADNEVHLALITERCPGAIQGVEDALGTQLGIGIGARVLVGGQLYGGATGAAGEIGCLPLPDPSSSPPDGIGPFAHAAGGRAFSRLGRRVAAGARGMLLRELAGGDPVSVDAEVIFRAAMHADPPARGVVEERVSRSAFRRDQPRSTSRLDGCKGSCPGTPEVDQR